MPRDRRFVVLLGLGVVVGENVVENWLLATLDNSWLRELEAESSNTITDLRSARQVQNGHWVMAEPSPLPYAYVAACSEEALALIGLSNSSCEEPAFVKLFSGSNILESGRRIDTWATPYALSIYGEAVVPDYAGPRGDGYGDGRAISFGEIFRRGERYELQWKGAGTTAFARRGDGRAVLRSSVREFLAAEAMAGLGVPTTRVGALVASRTCRVQRPWYASNTSSRYKHGGDMLRSEPCAIATRIAPSFIRIAHFELYARRSMDETVTLAERRRAMNQLERLARYAFERRDAYDSAGEDWLVSFARQAADRQARLVAEWLRVGYVQSNFNSDNCLVSGLTVDYGPMGFIERYHPEWVMWIGGGQHFAFMNQPEAARRNFEQLRKAVKLICNDSRCRKALDTLRFPVELYVDRVWANKLGFAEPSSDTARLAETLLNELALKYKIDFTIFFRQLCEIASIGSEDYALLQSAFYDDDQYGERHPDFIKSAEFQLWLRDWLNMSPDPDLMRRTNPKYIPREWMLAQAYTAAEKGDNSILRRLQNLFRTPYDEHPDSHEEFYRKAPDETLYQGGIGFMS